MNETPRSTQAVAIQTARDKARAAVLQRLLRGDATGAQLRSDLAARCGGRREVDRAREWLTAQKLVVADGASIKALFGLTRRNCGTRKGVARTSSVLAATRCSMLCRAP